MSLPKTIHVDGDSHSAYVTTQGGRPDQQWHRQMRGLLSAAGLDCQVRNFAIAGTTTAGVLARAYTAFLYDTPEIPAIAFLHIGVNDPVNSITTSQTQANIQAILKAWKYKCMGAGNLDAVGQWRNTGGAISVATQNDLPANGQFGQRYVVLADTSTTGGVQSAARPGEHALITGSVAADSNGQKQSVWEFRNTRAGELGWSRVALKNTAPWGIERIVVVATPYRNFTTGGDQVGTPLAQTLAVRGAQQAAITEENVTVAGDPSVVYGDIYTAMRARIVAGTDPDFFGGSFDATTSWHNQTVDQHLNPYGKRICAEVLADLILATWPTALAD